MGHACVSLFLPFQGFGRKVFSPVIRSSFTHCRPSLTLSLQGLQIHLQASAKATGPPPPRPRLLPPPSSQPPPPFHWAQDLQGPGVRSGQHRRPPPSPPPGTGAQQHLPRPPGFSPRILSPSVARDLKAWAWSPQAPPSHRGASPAGEEASQTLGPAPNQGGTGGQARVPSAPAPSLGLRGPSNALSRPAATMVTNVVRPVSSTLCPLPPSPSPLPAGPKRLLVTQPAPGLRRSLGPGHRGLPAGRQLSVFGQEVRSGHLHGPTPGGWAPPGHCGEGAGHCHYNLLVGTPGLWGPSATCCPVHCLGSCSGAAAGSGASAEWPNGPVPLGILQPGPLGKASITQVQYILPTLPQQLQVAPAPWD